tara:strand:- start:9 stop:407 length:399 start_codon:yes stop_codon:yes gene_type:complete
MKHLLSILILLGFITVVYSDTKELPEGSKFYCKEVLFEFFDEDGFVRDRVNSNKRVLFIIGNEKIYEVIENIAEYPIKSRTSYKTIAGRELSSRNDKITLLHEAVTIEHEISFNLYRNYYHYNCSLNRQEIY